MKYYQVKVASKVEDPKTGKIKNEYTLYLVDAVSVTDAEATITGHLEGTGFFEVKSVSESPIFEVVASSVK